MKQLFHCFAIFLWIASYSCEQTKSDQPTTQIGEWRSIFNGKDLNGWEKIGEFQTEIENDVLHISPIEANKDGWILTNDSYQNFILEIEFLMPDTTASSGILIRFDPNQSNISNSDYKINIDWELDQQNVMGTLGNIARSKFLGNADPTIWHKMRVEANGDNFQIFLNDQIVCETHDRRSRKGKIGLQASTKQGDGIAFRNIRLQQLPDTLELVETLEEEYRNSPQPLQAVLTDASFEGWHKIGNTSTWDFKEGIIQAYSGEQAGYLVTNETYKNFYLKCDFKIAKEDNSGIFIRKHPDSINVSLQDAIECNIYDHNGRSHAYSTGSIVTHARAFANLIDYENWNEMEIFAKEDHIILYINGKKSAEAHLPATFNKSGNICLQAGTRVFSDNSPSEVYFKEVMIREMD